MDEHPLIHFREGAAGRRPTLIGTRLDVATVIATVRQNDHSVEEAADYLRVPVSHVEACVRYYLAYQDEIDAWIERDEEEAEAAEIPGETPGDDRAKLLSDPCLREPRALRHSRSRHG